MARTVKMHYENDDFTVIFCLKERFFFLRMNIA